MPKITISPLFSSIRDVTSLARFVTQFCTNVRDIVNGKLRFTDNMQCQLLNTNFLVANTNQGFAHGLNAPINGFLVFDNQFQNGMVYRPDASNDSNSVVYLAATVPGFYQVLIFV